MNDTTRIPARSARLVAPPSLGLDGTPAADTKLDRRSTAARAADDARREIRAAFDALEADGFRDLAALAVDALDAVDRLRIGLAAA